MDTLLRERTTVREAVEQASPGLINVTLITPGQGSSGYYSDSVLEAAAADRVFPAGTLMFLDHATETEAFDRPERSVKDIGAILTEDAAWTDGALKAPAKLVGPWAETLQEMRDAIGVSICARGDLSEGKITKLTPSVDNSVDFVTYPGRGGSFALLESRRPSRVVARAVEHGVAEATANDTREALQAALTERFGGERIYLWVRDFDEDTVWYWLESPDEDATYQLGYSMSDDGTATLQDSDPVEVTVRTSYVPVNPTEASNTPEESTMPQIEESRLAQLERDAGRATEADQRATAAEQRASTAERERDTLRARESARPIVTELVNASESLPASSQSRLIESSLTAPPMRDDGTLDEAALRKAVEAARTQAETELAEALAAAGVGQVRGFGGGGQSTDDGGADSGTREESDRARSALFGRKIEKGA